MVKKGTKSLKLFDPCHCTSSLLYCEVAFQQRKKEKENSVLIVLATEFGGEGKKELFTEESSHTGVVPAAPWAGWLQTFNYL